MKMLRIDRLPFSDDDSLCVCGQPERKHKFSKQNQENQENQEQDWSMPNNTFPKVNPAHGELQTKSRVE
jgi:hypothetical protein